MDSQTFLYIIICILVLSNIYLFYKTRKIESDTGKIEGFAVNDEIKEEIKKIYNADIDAIRNLSSIATDITKKNDTLTIPAGNTKMSGNTEISGKLTVNGDVEFINKDTGFMNIMPKFTIVAFYGDDVPKGWALADGKTYKLNSTGVAYEVAASDTTGTKTPDLRGRMIIGIGQGNGLTNRNKNDAGGYETHTLTEAEMPSHNHNLHVGYGTGGTDYYRVDMYANKADWGLKNAPIKHAGGNQPHNNMPPWYAVNYIMKL